MARKRQTTKKPRKENHNLQPKKKAPSQKHRLTLINEIAPKTPNQDAYFEAIRRNRIVLCSGPAGSGKTLIASYFAAMGLVNGDYNKIIICRAAIEACGEKLGFLPGDAAKKMQYYTVPVANNLKKFLGWHFDQLVKEDAIEILPVAYARGRDFKKTFVILDEAQNSTYESFKCLLTRLDDSSKIVCTGDFDQSDLHQNQTDFEKVCYALRDMYGVEYISMNNDDIIRSKWIGEIVERLGEIEQPQRTRQCF